MTPEAALYPTPWIRAARENEPEGLEYRLYFIAGTGSVPQETWVQVRFDKSDEQRIAARYILRPGSPYVLVDTSGTIGYPYKEEDLKIVPDEEAEALALSLGFALDAAEEDKWANQIATRWLQRGKGGSLAKIARFVFGSKKI